MVYYVSFTHSNDHLMPITWSLELHLGDCERMLGTGGEVIDFMQLCCMMHILFDKSRGPYVYPF